MRTDIPPFTPRLDPPTRLLPLLTAGVRRLDEAMAGFVKAAVDALTNAERAVARLEARYQVRAGFGPGYGQPDLDVLVSGILSGTYDDLRLLTPSNRMRVVAAAVRGWAAANPDIVVPAPVWHRLLGDTVVTTGPAA